MNVSKRAVWLADRHLVSHSFTLSHRAGRALIEVLALFDLSPRGVKISRGTAGGIGCWRVAPAGADDSKRIFFVHGGAYCINSPRVYTAFAGHLALATGASVILPRYRLAPEHPYPAGLEDVLAAYRAVRENTGRLVMAGDSAGAGMSLCAAIALRDRGEEAPDGLFLMSPWVDLTTSGESIHANDGKDAILRAKALPRHALAYAGGLDLADPRLSPLNADHSGLPPTLVQCGGDELFLSEGVELASRLEAAGTPVKLQVYEGMWHDFQAHAGMLEEAATAVRRVGEWSKPLLA
jgi:epsilon-lactone hydrolase